MSVFSVELCLAGMPSRAKRDATPIFVVINSEGFAKTFKNKLIYTKRAI